MASALPCLFFDRAWQFTRSTALAAALIALAAHQASAGITVDYSQLPPAPMAAPAPSLTLEGYRQIIRLHSPIARQNFAPIAAPVALPRAPIVLHPPAQKIVLIPPPPLGQSTAVASTLANIAPVKSKAAVAPKTQIANVSVTTTQNPVEPAALPQTIIQSPHHGPTELTVWQRAPLPNTLIQWPGQGILDGHGAGNFPPVLPATPAQIIIVARVINAERRRGLHGAKPPVDAVAIPIIEPPSVYDDKAFTPPPILAPAEAQSADDDMFTGGIVGNVPQPATVIANKTYLAPVAHIEEIAAPRTQISPVAALPELPPISAPQITTVYSATDGDQAPLPKTVIQQVNTAPPVTNSVPHYSNVTETQVPLPQANITPIVAAPKPVISTADVVANDIAAEVPLPQTQIMAAAPVPRNTVTHNVAVPKAASSSTVASLDADAPAPQTAITPALQATPLPPTVFVQSPAAQTHIADIPPVRPAIAQAPVISHYATLDEDAPLPRTVISATARPKAGLPKPQIQVAQEDTVLPVAVIDLPTAANTMADETAASPHTTIALAPAQRSAVIASKVMAAPIASANLDADAPLPHTQVINLTKPVPQPTVLKAAPVRAVEAAPVIAQANTDAMAVPATTQITTFAVPAVTPTPIIKSTAKPAIAQKIEQPQIMPAVESADVISAQPKTVIAATTFKPAVQTRVPTPQIVALPISEVAQPKTVVEPLTITPPTKSIADINAEIAASEASIAASNQKIGTPAAPAKSTVNKPTIAPTIVAKKETKISTPVAPTPTLPENTPAIIANDTAPANASLTTIEAQIAATEADVAALNKKIDIDSKQAARIKPGKLVANNAVTPTPIAPQTTIATASPTASNKTAAAAANYTEMMARLQETEATLAKLKADNAKLNDRVTTQQVDQDAMQAEKSALLNRLSAAEQNLNTLEKQRTDLKAVTAPQLPTASQKSLDAVMDQRLAQTQNELKTILPNTEKVIGGQPPETQVVQLPTMEEAAAPTVISSSGAARGAPTLARQMLQYANGASQLDANQSKIIDRFAQQLRDNPALQLVVKTYGGSGGAASDARRMALNRASALQSALRERGVAANQLQIQAVGVPPQIQQADQAELLIK